MMKKCDPFLKWPGGKRWLIPFFQEIINPNEVETYFEPFIGGGAVFFSFNFENAILSDTNEDLINTYRVVKEFPDELIIELKKIPQDKQTYYKIRKIRYDDKIRKAAQFLYLNRLAFGGMYRVNLEGKYNVPYGGERRADILWTKNLIQNASLKLQGIKLECLDFEDVLRKAKKNDLIYCDPPYTVAHNLNGFQRYNEKIFSWQDQVRLSEECFKAANRGVKLIVSNAAHDSLKELYSTIKPIIVNRYSGLSRKTNCRRCIDEYVFLFNL
jgi:DNA adenine methylase